MELDSQKMHAERNKLGQFATPSALAGEMLDYARRLLPKDVKIRFLDPAIGTGSFYSALLRAFPLPQIEAAAGYEIDAEYARAARETGRGAPLEVHTADFTRVRPPSRDGAKFNLIICNPPYIRHHHLPSAEKERLQKLTEQTVGIRLNGLAGAYCHFLCLSHAWLARDGIAGWLIPSEFMDVNYGRELKKYLLSRVTLLHVHRFDPKEVQFEDALVSSAVVWFRQAATPAEFDVEFSYGGTLLNPRVSKPVKNSVLREAAKWTAFPLNSEKATSTRHQVRLGDLFEIKRGLATGANAFFVMTSEDAQRHGLPDRFLTPILPSPRLLKDEEINGGERGVPENVQKLFLLRCDMPEDRMKVEYPSLWEYIQEGARRGLNERYLCRNRSPWYAQENRPPAPLLCTYMGRYGTHRGRPFRFILNNSGATATNVYLMLYPKPILAGRLRKNPDLLRTLWRILNEIPPDTLASEGRVYGGGLHKLEPKELANVPADALLSALPRPLDAWV